jgi:hypothetical protein
MLTLAHTFGAFAYLAYDGGPPLRAPAFLHHRHRQLRHRRHGRYHRHQQEHMIAVFMPGMIIISSSMNE